MSKFKDSHTDAWRHYAAAWNGVSYRYRAAAEHSEAFASSVTKYPSPSGDDRYIQDHNLFAFHSCAASCIECFYFGVLCIASIVDAKAFPVTTARDLRLYPTDVQPKFAAAYPSEKLTHEMAACLSDPMYLAIKEQRDALSHRGSPGRTYFQGGPQHGKTMIPANPKAPSALWSYDLEVSADAISTRMQWLSATSSALLRGADEYCEAHLK